MIDVTEADTKTAILNAAEELFVDQGFEGTSLRSVVAQAKVNIAAVHYHYGSKDALIQAVLIRRLDPINQQRLAMLNEAEAAAGNRKLKVETILRALFEPAIRLSGCGKPGKNKVAQLIGRMFSEPSSSLQVFLMERFQEVFSRFSQALRNALPNLPELDFYWRIHFMIGSMCHALYDQERPGIISGGLCQTTSVDEMLDQLIAFVAGGLRAKAISQKEQNQS